MFKNSVSRLVVLYALAILSQDMVMMGQQYLDTDRKSTEENDDYLNQNNTTRERNNQQSAERIAKEKEKMAKREIPTLKSLAERSHNQLTYSDREVKIADNDNNDIIALSDKNLESIDLISNQLKSEVVRINGSGDGPQEEEEEEKDQHFDKEVVAAIVVEISASSAVVTSNGNGESLSGRNSSLAGDSSGMGSSLTSSASSEPVERDALSPSSENGGISNGGVGDSAEADDVPVSNNKSDDESNSFLVTVVNGDDSSGGGSSSGGENSSESESQDVVLDSSCKALVLKDNNMTAGKQFLHMVRGRIGLKEHEQNSSSSSKIQLAEAGTTSGNGANSGSSSTKKSNWSSSNGRPANAQLASSNGIVYPNLSAECIQDVWANNLIEEFAKIRQVVKRYNFIAMDSEFPGVIFRPPQSSRSGAGGVFPYQLLKNNVDHLKIIQLGVTFMDKDGRMPPGICTWQFNFHFSLSKDMYAEDSISLLQRCGLQFQKHSEMGIDPAVFGEYFMSSGMVTSEDVTYLTFHSGFDFGYLMKLLSSSPLPDSEDRFFDLMRLYFPNVYDLKFLMKSVDLHGGLQDIANQVGQERVGIQHQAGSDSLLTGMTYFKLLHSEVFNGEIDPTKYSGKLYGFHMTATDGKDEGLIPREILDTTSPKPYSHRSSTSTNHNCTTTVRNMNTNVPPNAAAVIALPYHQHLLQTQTPQVSSSTNLPGDSNNNR